MKVRENVLKTLMDIAQNAVGRDFSGEEKLDFRKELEYKLPDICTGSISAFTRTGMERCCSRSPAPWKQKPEHCPPMSADANLTGSRSC